MNPLPSQPPDNSGRNIVVGGGSSVTPHSHSFGALQGDVQDVQLPDRLATTCVTVAHCSDGLALKSGWWRADPGATDSPDTASNFIGQTWHYLSDPTFGDFRAQIATEVQTARRRFHRNQVAGSWSAWEQVDRTFYDSRYVPIESSQVAQSGAVTPNGTANSTLTGLSISVTSPGTSAVYMVEIDADVTFVGSQTNIIELLVDGVAETAQLISGAAATGYRIDGHKKWRITGLAAGSRTFTARTRNSAAGTNATVNLTHTLMTVQRVA
jgi:hypothetical protein